MAKASPLNYSGNQDDENGIPDTRTMKDGGAPSDFDKLQQQPFGAGAMAPGKANGGGGGNGADEPLPGSPPGFPQSFEPMGKDNPFAGIVAAHQQAQQQNGVADTRPMAQGGAPSSFDRLQQAPSQWQQLQQQQFGAGALSNPGTPTAKGGANDPNNMNWTGQPAQGAGSREPMPGPPPGQKPIDETQPDMGTVPVGGSVIGQSTKNRSFNYINKDGRMENYAQDPRKGIGDWQRLQESEFGANSLANTAARPVGRSIKDHPVRRIEMAERAAIMNNDEAGAAHFAGIRLGLKQQQQGMDFARERDERNFDQQKEMFGLHQQAQGARDAAHAQREDMMWSRDQEARHNQDQVDWEHQMTMFGFHNRAQQQRDEQRRQQELDDRNRTPNVGFTPIPGSDYGIPTADGKPMGTVPQHQDKPKGPTPEEISKHIQEMDAKGVKAQHGKNGWTYEPKAAKAETVKVVNDQGKVVDFPADHEVPAGWKELKKKGEGGKSAAPPAANSGGTTKPSSFLNF